MLTSKKALLEEAKVQGYKPEILEKVYRLINIFQQITSVPYLEERLVLKGGTALNLFFFEPLPRLSIDIDLNYIGQLDREAMLREKGVVIDAIQEILRQNQYERYRSPMYHAGGKMIWLYQSLLGQRGTLEIDINFMYRQPLFPIVHQSPKIEAYKNWQAPVLDLHELAAGKLSALMNRRASRDLFDVHYLMTQASLDVKKLRTIFVIYLAMTPVDLKLLRPEFIEYDLVDLKNRLLPVMQQNILPRNLVKLKMWAAKAATELQKALSAILPLQENELEFIEKIRIEAHIQPELITTDMVLAAKVVSHPAIQWAVKRSTQREQKV